MQTKWTASLHFFAGKNCSLVKISLIIIKNYLQLLNVEMITKLSLFITLLGFCHCGDKTRIFGGDDVIDFKLYNYMGSVNVYDPDTVLLRGECAGTVVHAQYILTAAHCFFPPGVHSASNFSMISLGSKVNEFFFPPERVEVQGYPVSDCGSVHNRRNLLTFCI